MGSRTPDPILSHLFLMAWKGYVCKEVEPCNLTFYKSFPVASYEYTSWLSLAINSFLMSIPVHFVNMNL